MPGWKVAGYAELKLLGSGGFGEVVLARHDASGTLVAIKYLRHELLTDAEWAQMFRDEAAVLASLDDPNVVRLYEYVESPWGAAIVMELIGGVSLREILKYQGSTTAEAALVVLEGSLLGLAAAHRRGVVHRDYKPENVLVDGDGISKLTDFGIAARSGEQGIPAGTLHYAPPEQMAGGPASPAGDVYSATATFYECLTGRPPFSGDEAELLRKHRVEPVPLEPVPEPLRPLVAAGMAKEPSGRPADGTAFAAELGMIASGAYGPDWRERGRSHLGAAALLLAALWPAGPPPTVQGTAVHRIWLRRPARLGHISAAKAAIAASALVVVAAASTALAAPRSPSRPTAATRPAQVVQSVSLQPTTTQPSTSATGSSPSPTPTLQAGTSPSGLSPSGTSPSPSLTQSSSTQPSPSPTQVSTTSSGPTATGCEPNGTGCTKAGTYPGPNAVINSNLGGFQVVWTSSVVAPYSSGVPLYWTAYITYTNMSSSSLQLDCSGSWVNASFVAETMSGGAGNNGTVAAESTYCSQNPNVATLVVPPGGTFTSWATFHNVPWPGSAVSIQWGDVGTSAPVHPFG